MKAHVPPINSGLARLVALGAALFLLLAGCAPTAPAPTAAPSKPAESKPAAPATAAPAVPAAPAEAKPAAAVASPAAAQPVAAEAAVPLKVAMAVTLNYAPIFAGVEKGLFLKHGIDLKPMILNSGPEVTKALQAGEVPIAFAVQNNVIGSRAQDIKMKGFGLLVNDALVENPDTMLAILANGDTGISTVSDLKGKRVGTISGTSPDLYLRTLIRRSGMKEDEVQILNLRTTELVVAMKKKELDATVAAEPYAEMILAEVPGAKTVVRGGGVVSQRILLVGMEPWLEQNRPTAERLVGGLTEAMWWTRQNLDEAGEISARWLGGGADPTVIKKAIRNLTFDPRHGKLPEQSWINEGNLLVEQKRIKTSVPYAEGFDPTFADAIPERYPQWVADLKPLP